MRNLTRLTPALITPALVQIFNRTTTIAEITRPLLTFVGPMPCVSTIQARAHTFVSLHLRSSMRSLMRPTHVLITPALVQIFNRTTTIAAITRPLLTFVEPMQCVSTVQARAHTFASLHLRNSMRNLTRLTPALITPALVQIFNRTMTIAEITRPLLTFVEPMQCVGTIQARAHTLASLHLRCLM